MKKFFVNIFIVTITFFVMSLFHLGHASAASLTLNGGCSVDNAILSANNNADTGGCVGSGVYGDDTINVPAGTWNISTNVVSEGNLTVVGAGMGESIIDAGDNYAGIICENSGAGLLSLNVIGLTIQNTASSSGAFPLGAGNCNLTVSNTEILGGQDDANIIFQLMQDGVTAELNISQVYIHDTLGAGVVVLVEGDGVANQANVEIDNLTVDRAFGPNMYLGGVGISVGNKNVASTHTVNVRMRNSTLTGNGLNPSLGISGLVESEVSGNNDVINMTLENNTIVNHSIDGGFPAAGILAGASTISGATANVAITTQNVITANNVTDSVQTSCAAVGLGSGGTEIASITSLGNNLSDDASCGFTSMGDQENLAGLIGTLGLLQDNGGAVPTMALLANSPAIDAGATISGIAFDQRGVTRPQCASYDAGAYEYDGVCPAAITTTPPASSSSTTGDSDGLADTGDSVLTYRVVIVGLVLVGFGLIVITRLKLQPQQQQKSTILRSDL